MIVIVDYGMGNLRSIANMIKKVGGSAVISSRLQDVASASKLVLPGVGSFDNGMNSMKKRGLIAALNEKALQQQTPVLGICLGMQLMTRSSEEGDRDGLGWFDADTRRFQFPASDRKKVPNMGWRMVKPWRNGFIFQEAADLPRFYFVHSYHVACDRREDVLATAHYGYEFCCAIQRDNICGLQFHPEKSHRFGCGLLRNFVEFTGVGRAAA